MTALQGEQVLLSRVRYSPAVLLQTHWLLASRMKGEAHLIQVVLSAQVRHPDMQGRQADPLR